MAVIWMRMDMEGRADSGWTLKVEVIRFTDRLYLEEKKRNSARCFDRNNWKDGVTIN